MLGVSGGAACVMTHQSDDGVLTIVSGICRTCQESYLTGTMNCSRHVESTISSQMSVNYVATSGVTETERVIRRFEFVGFDSIGACLSPV